MTKEVVAKMFLANERGLNETDWLRSWNTFNFGKYYNEYKTPAGDIYVLNDDMLDGGRSLSMLVEEDSYIILLPVAGAVAYKDSLGNESLLAAGQIQVVCTAKGTTIQMINPFQDHLINFLQIWIRAEKVFSTLPSVSTYDVNKFQNSLVKISPQQLGSGAVPFTISIGKFAGRGETVYQPAEKSKGLFAFVLAGAFELEGRLLHDRDGLALWNTNHIDMEALSNDAILLLIEMANR
jgi:quercetin 2,3-dioxygenase